MEPIVFKRNDIISVLGEDNEYWFCKSLQNLNLRNKSHFFKAIWFEKHVGPDYVLQSMPNLVPIESFICKVRLKKVKAQGVSVYQLPSKTKLKLEKLISKYNSGFWSEMIIIGLIRLALKGSEKQDKHQAYVNSC